MNYVQFMDILYASDDLLENGASFVLGDSLSLKKYFLLLTM